MVCIAVCALVCSGILDIARVGLLGYDKVSLVPGFGSRMTPSASVDEFIMEKRVGDTEVMI